MTLRDDYELWARHFPRPMGEGWGVFLDSIKDGTYDSSVFDAGFISPSQMHLDSSAAPSWVAFTGNAHTIGFGASAAQSVDFSWRVPRGYKDGTDLTPKVRWAPADSAAGDVYWQIYYTWKNVGDVHSGTSTLTKTATSSGTTLKEQSDEFSDIAGSSMSNSSVITVNLVRQAANVADTYTSSALIVGFEFVYEEDKAGSDTR